MLSTLTLLHCKILTAQQLLVAGPLHSNCSICSSPSDSARDRAETSRHPTRERQQPLHFRRILRPPFAFLHESYVYSRPTKSLDQLQML